jgi:hypothetical protein
VSIAIKRGLLMLFVYVVSRTDICFVFWAWRERSTIFLFDVKVASSRMTYEKCPLEDNFATVEGLSIFAWRIGFYASNS